MPVSASNARMRKQNMSKLYSRQVLSLIAIFFVGSVVINAQSGRRSTNGTKTATEPSVSGPKTIEKKPDTTPRLQFLVGIDNRDPTSNIPFYLADTVMDNCIRRLGDAADVIVTSAGSMSRAEAVKRAKEETVRYVVWLQIGSELADSGRQQKKNDVDELYANYTIIEPGTAKFKQTGRSFTLRNGCRHASRALLFPLFDDPGVPLRFTPGFMLSPRFAGLREGFQQPNQYR